MRWDRFLALLLGAGGVVDQKPTDPRWRRLQWDISKKTAKREMMRESKTGSGSYVKQT